MRCLAGGISVTFIVLQAKIGHPEEGCCHACVGIMGKHRSLTAEGQPSIYANIHFSRWHLCMCEGKISFGFFGGFFFFLSELEIKHFLTWNSRYRKKTYLSFFLTSWSISIPLPPSPTSCSEPNSSNRESSANWENYRRDVKVGHGTCQRILPIGPVSV